MSVTTGFLLSGERLAAEPVTLECADGMYLRVSSAMRDAGYALAAVKASDRLGNIARFIYLPDGSVVETLDNDAVDRWFAEMGRERGNAFVHLLETHRGVAAIACLLVAAFVGFGLYWGPPRFARALANRVPLSVETAAGQASLASLGKFFPPASMPEASRQRAEDQLTRVLGPKATLPRPALEFRMMGSMPNAFALPGGTIVIAKELVLQLSDDELAAVLAHEVGHLAHHHGSQTVLRNSFALLFVSGVTGDLSVLTSFAAALPLTVLRNGYSRDLERDADAYALGVLKARGIPPKSFTTALYRLESATKQSKQQLGYLSTHPDNDERMAMFGVLTAAEQQNLTKEMDDARAKLAKLAVPTSATGQPVYVFPPIVGTFETRSVPTPNHVVSEPPRVIDRKRPHYPEVAFKARLSGEVLVNFVVEADGTITNPYVVKSTNPIFDNDAVNAVSGWTFIPGSDHHEAVRVHMKVPIVFQLEEEEQWVQRGAAHRP